MCRQGLHSEIRWTQIALFLEFKSNTPWILDLTADGWTQIELFFQFESTFFQNLDLNH